MNKSTPLRSTEFKMTCENKDMNTCFFANVPFICLICILLQVLMCYTFGEIMLKNVHMVSCAFQHSCPTNLRSLSVAPAFDSHPSAAGYPQLDANYLSASQVHAISSTTFSFSLFLNITLNWLPKRVTLFPYSLTNSCFYYKTCRDTFFPRGIHCSWWRKFSVSGTSN